MVELGNNDVLKEIQTESFKKVNNQKLDLLEQEVSDKLHSTKNLTSIEKTIAKFKTENPPLGTIKNTIHHINLK